MTDATIQTALPQQNDDRSALTSNVAPVAETPATEEATPAAPPQPPPKPFWLMAIYIMAGQLFFITQGMGMNIVNANLYNLQGEFSATVAEVAGLSAAYMAPYASLSIALFKIRSQYGLRPFAELSIALFLVASCLNLFVTDLHSAIVIRFVSGMAAAPLSSLGFLYTLEAFPVQKKLSLGLSIALMGTLMSAPLARMVSPGLLDIDGWTALYTLEMGLALIALPLIYLLPLTPPPRAKVLERMDILSYALLATGLGSLAVFLTLGRFYWWLETQWLGILLACSIGLLALMVVIELPRKKPMLDLRWIFSPTNLHMAAVLLIFRGVTSEQSSTAVGLYQQLGLLNDQTIFLYGLVLAASLIGGIICAMLMMSKYVDFAHVVSLGMIASGAYMDSFSNSLTRPEQMYMSQAMIAFGAAMFLPPVMAKGFGAAMQKGMPYVVNFITIFLFTQITGSMMMTAALGTFVTIREKFHSNVLVENILLTNPQVVQRVGQLSSAYAKVVTDKTLLSAEGIALLGQQVTRESYVLAYNDTFLLIAICAFAALLLLLIHLAWMRIRPLLKSEPANASTASQS